MIYEELKGDLFDAEADYYAHACNCMGVWGAGVAAVFARRFPEAYKQYQKDCREYGAALLGTAKVYGKVICLFTSYGYGSNVSPEDVILVSTMYALENLKENKWVPAGATIASPRFNSGLFGVPWNKTRNIVFDVLEDCDMVWKTRYL